MTLINVVYIPTGIVLSADSRTSGNGFIVSDSTNKLFLLFNKIGVATAGAALINLKPIEHYVKEFEMLMWEKLSDASVKDVTDELYDYFKNIVIGEQYIFFFVAGYEFGTPIVNSFDTMGEKEIFSRNTDKDDNLIYGAAWQGDTEIVNRLRSENHMPLYIAMNVQDAIDYSRHLIRTTIDQLRFEPRFPTVGGEIETILVQPTGGGYIYKKGLTYK
ncbi:hypothetical protein [Paenibacillus sp. ACRRY]|uniref:hypothetical protein n=1 Tax=Paenibacillus sp. ACRRY TaxID=2918208 RepID=UPI001EF4261E|nr:hypothetical protein [Paenibacillus sp. ACRRY]MCG7385090.1 hypothetical protein [Paenibacillus sp. ACRRY]